MFEIRDAHLCQFFSISILVQIGVQNMQKMEHMEMEMAMVQEIVKLTNFVIMKALAKLNVQNVPSMERKVMECTSQQDGDCLYSGN